MKKLIITGWILTAIFIQSCRNIVFSGFDNKAINGNGHVITEQRKISGYDQLLVTGSYDVHITGKNEGEISVTADDNLMPYIQTYVKDGKLIITTDKEVNIYNYKKLDVEIPAVPLHKILLTGSGNIHNDEKMKTDHIKLQITGSGDINLLVDSDKAESYITGSGDIGLRGKTNELKTFITGSGDIDARAFTCGSVEVKTTGSGDVYVNPSEYLYARITGSGDLYYFSEPEKTDIKIMGGGDAIYKNTGKHE